MNVIPLKIAGLWHDKDLGVGIVLDNQRGGKFRVQLEPTLHNYYIASSLMGKELSKEVTVDPGGIYPEIAKIFDDFAEKKNKEHPLDGTWKICENSKEVTENW